MGSKFQPVPAARLRSIAEDACTSALSSAPSYQHTSTESWNSQIINRMLESLVSFSQTSSAPQPPTPGMQFKYAVSSTIIQHLADGPETSTSSGGTQTAPEGGEDGAGGMQASNGTAAGKGVTKGKRGMHSAMGGYWNNDTDGMWSYKHEAQGMDVVVNVIWMATG